MQIDGKILFYNEKDGNGLVITKDHQKINFNISNWTDFDVMPVMGLNISFDLKDNTCINMLVISKNKTNTDETKEINNQQPDDESIKSPSKDENSSKLKAHSYKNSKLTESEEEIVGLLNDSKDNVEFLNKKIELTGNISDTMEEYFKKLQAEIFKRNGYKKVDGRLNYLLSKRFLWTTCNNLIDIDFNIVTMRIKAIREDLMYMEEIYSDFSNKINYPSAAFEDIFLSYQKEYQLVHKANSKINDKLSSLKNQEQSVDAERKKHKLDIKKNTNKDNKSKMLNQLKVLNGTYVDVIHMIAELDFQHKENLKKLHDFEGIHKDNFYEKFIIKAKKHKSNILEILDAQAFLLDSSLWKEARVSISIKQYFKESMITGDLNTMTYLKYFLNSLDEGKTNKSSQELFDLYNYLEKMHKNYILLIQSSYQEIMDNEFELKKRVKSCAVKSFTNELSSLQWAMKNSVKVIVIENNLQSTNAQKYLDAYHNNILSKPKIIVIGNIEIVSKEYKVDKILNSSVAPALLAKTINNLLC